jgi:hypothetical protein
MAENESEPAAQIKTESSGVRVMTDVTKMNIAKNLVEKIEELLDGKAHYFICCDRTTEHEKIVIEYNHQKK